MSESVELEFKGAFSWNRRRKAVDEQLKFGTTRTVAAFANTQGGRLCIGYADDSEVIGIEDEIASMKSPSVDQYEQNIHQHLKDKLFPYPFRAIAIEIVKHAESGLLVCYINVQPQPGVTYVKNLSKDGVNENLVYVRTGNRSIKLADLQRDKFVVERCGGTWTL